MDWTFTLTPAEQQLLRRHAFGPVVHHLASVGAIGSADAGRFTHCDGWSLLERVCDDLWSLEAIAHEEGRGGGYEALARRAQQLMDDVDAVDFCARCGRLDDVCECYALGVE